MGYGVTKGVSGIIIAAASLDDILAISMFGIFLGVGMSGADSHGIFPGDALLNAILMGPFEIVAGVILGIVVGVVLRFDFFARIKAVWKAVLCVCVATALVFSLGLANLSGLGLLATISFASIGGTKWGTEEAEHVEDYVSVLWKYVQVPLFGLIGAAIYVGDLKGSDVGLGLLVIMIGLVFRLPAACASMYGTNLNNKEKLFVGIAWMPKATVQAALGGVVLGMAEKNDLGSDYERWGLEMLTIAFLCIVVTAPAGAILSAFLGPKLLAKEEPPTDQLEEHVFSHRWVEVRKKVPLDQVLPHLLENQ
jgi:hypothetical protein